jgi:5-methylcytosine-specific restriction endonuclease McrA
MTNTRVTVAWIIELIQSGDTSPFYNTKEWGALRERKRRQEHYECERCRAKGRYKRGKIVHHKKYLKDYPELALDINNLECLCEECHYEEHHKRKEQIIPERW